MDYDVTFFEFSGFSLGPGGRDQDARSNNVNISPVPEPATLALLGSGLLGLAGYRWQQRRREETHLG